MKTQKFSGTASPPGQMQYFHLVSKGIHSIFIFFSFFGSDKRTVTNFLNYHIIPNFLKNQWKFHLNLIYFIAHFTSQRNKIINES